MTTETQFTMDSYFTNHDIQDTSQAAYKAIRKRKFSLQSIHSKIITLLEENPDGLSIGEMAGRLVMQKSTISARVSELRKCSVIVYLEHRDSAESGVTNAIWVLSIHYKEHMELV